jgi:serine/threonine protein phosphatase PrpC
VRPVPFAALWGDEHPELGDIAVTGLGAHTALGLSAGRFPKSYWHLDPNEDGVVAVGDAGTRVLAVGDGHNGFDAAAAGLMGVAYEALQLLAAPPVTGAEVTARALARARRSVADALQGLVEPRGRSRTALSIAVIDAGVVHAATHGDSSVVRVRRGKAKLLTAPSDFLGPRTPTPEIASARARDGDVIVVVSDGVSDFLGSHWPETLAKVVAAASDAQAGVQQIIQLAHAGGAGDHIAVALSQVGDTTS